MSETKTDEAIRNLLQEHGEPAARKLRGRDKLPPLADPVPGERPPKTAKAQAKLRKWLDPVLSYRPTKKHIFVFLCVVLVLWRPWLVFWTAFLLFAVGVVIYFSAGPDACAERVSRVFAWYAGKRPESAERIRAQAARNVLRLERVLRILPGKWTQGLYLPDFDGSQSQALDDTSDPFDRLSVEQGQT
jgi:hypothetical protein